LDLESLASNLAEEIIRLVPPDVVTGFVEGRP
jgi:hypothetical protein